MFGISRKEGWIVVGLIALISGVILMGNSPVLAQQGGCPCFKASIIDGAFAAKGPDNLLSGSCFDVPYLPAASISSPLVSFRVEYGIDETAECNWFDSDNGSRTFDNISQAQAHQCRNEIIRSDVWSLIDCPTD